MKNFNAITHAHVWVLDHQEALDFYVGKLGLEVNDDTDFGFMRWLTVSVPERPGQQLIICSLDSAVSPADAELARNLMAKGLMGIFILATADCRGTYEALRARGVEFAQQPTEMPYGVECCARDPFGNQIRICERTPVPSNGTARSATTAA